MWSVKDASTPFKAAIESGLDATLNLYLGQMDERNWYGFWNYGDVMHSFDNARHVWRYDLGGMAWDNSELGTDSWLWYSYLRIGRADIFRLAEAMTRHTGEVDSYHFGPMAGLGTRHGVSHWGDGAKEVRIGQAAFRRFYYYLTSDERTGDVMHEALQAEQVGHCVRPDARGRSAARGRREVCDAGAIGPGLAGPRRQLDDGVGAHRQHAMARQDCCRHEVDGGHAPRIPHRQESC